MLAQLIQLMLLYTAFTYIFVCKDADTGLNVNIHVKCLLDIGHRRIN